MKGELLKKFNIRVVNIAPGDFKTDIVSDFRLNDVNKGGEGAPLVPIFHVNIAKNFPKEFLHRPWELDLELQKKINIVIGKDYPRPIVNHEIARTSALESFNSLKK